MDSSSFPTSGSFRDKVTFLLQYAILSPSPHNNQPWKVVWEDADSAYIAVDKEYTLYNGTPRLTVITLGAFVENLLEAAAHYSVAISVDEPEMTARLYDIKLAIRKADTPPQETTIAFAGLTKRHTNRGLYSPEPLSTEVHQTLSEVTREPGVQVAFITDAHLREKAAKLASVGMRIALSLAPLRRELSKYVHFLHEKSATGMVAEAMVQNATPIKPDETGDQWVMKRMPVAEEAAFTQEKFATAPLQVIISTERDSLRDQFATGRTMQRLLNTAASLDLTHCIAAAATEIPVLSPRFREISGSSAKPQLFLRLGTPLNPEFTLTSPRRSVDLITKEQ
jgi:hypothetical protein